MSTIFLMFFPVLAALAFLIGYVPTTLVLS